MLYIFFRKKLLFLLKTMVPPCLYTLEGTYMSPFSKKHMKNTEMIFFIDSLFEPSGVEKSH